jgi:uracil-DNA glycosylase|tara:strand:- start:3354 stop:4049 length:696 start_codon:yes stop_codon:yes gene_type:complete
MQENINLIKKKLMSDFEVSGWSNILNPFLESKAFDSITNKLSDLISQDRRFTPKFKNAFAPFIETSLSNLKVVIVNQDPYPKYGIADGLAFSCSNAGIEESALKYIFDYIEKQSTNAYKRDTDLKRWANQGVLLINTSLTCELNKIGTHQGIWKVFIEYLFEMINRMDKKIIFVLMGRKVEHWQLRLPKQKIFKCPHPASAAYGKGEWEADNIFKKINDELNMQIKTCINW